MKTVFEDQTIHQHEGGNYVSFLMEDTGKFSPTGYKVLWSGNYKGLLQCTKVLFNGQIKLVYPTGEYRRLNRMLSSLSEAELIQIMVNMISVLLDMKENTLLKYSNIDLSEEHIFIKYKTKEVQLIYLPVNGTGAWIDEYEFYSGLRTKLAELCMQFTQIPGARLRNFMDCIQNPECSLQKICQDFKEEHEYATGNREQAGEPEEKDELSSTLMLRYTGIEKSLEFAVSKDEYILGRSPYRADGKITGNLRVGNVHCKIIREGMVYFAMDMQSRNGTFLNGRQLMPGEKTLLKRGDILKLADESFAVDIVRGM